MTKTLIATLIVAPLALAACTPADGATSGPTTSSTAVSYAAEDKVVESPPVIEEEVASEEDIFLAQLDNQGIAYTTDSAAIQGGVAVCGFIDEGNSPSELFWEMALEEPVERILPPVSNEDLPSFMGVAVAILCPEFKARVARDLAGN